MSELRSTSKIAWVFPFLLCVFFSNAVALDIDYAKQTARGCQLPEKALVLSGRIDRGDSEKISSWLRQNTWYLVESNPPFVLDLQGGSLSEAMKIADTFKQVLASAWLPGECENSKIDARPKCTGSCFAILIGAVNRLFSANAIGLNRPNFSQSDFPDVDIHAANEQYHKDLVSYLSWLKGMHIPVSLVEKIEDHSLENIYWLSEQDANLIAETSPAYHHLAATECAYEKGLLNQWMDAYSSGKSEEAILLRQKWHKQSSCLESLRISAREKWALQ